MNHPLATVCETMLALTRRELDPEDAARTLSVEAPRLRLYRELVDGHLASALTKLYPTTLASLEDAATHLIEEYRRLYPPRHRDLNLAGLAFPNFLDQRGHAFCASLAQLEWELFAAAIHPALVEPPERGLRLNPTLSIFEQFFPAVQYLVAHPEPHSVRAPTLPARRGAAEVVLVFRRPATHAVVFRVLDASRARVLAAFASDPAPASAGEPEDLTRALELGLVLSPEHPARERA